MGLTCALLATLLQQWARRYLWVTQPPCTPHRRSRIRSFFAEGVERLQLPWAVEALPTLLHCSLMLFFAGLVIFLFNIHHTIFTVVLGWVGFCAGIYVCITFMPVFRQDSPYYTPLTLSAWCLVNSFLYVLFGFLSWLERFHFYNYHTWRRFGHVKATYFRRRLKGVIKTAEETAQGLASAIDGRALLWTLESLDEDLDLERFFAAIPGFCNSKVVVDPLGAFIKPNDKKLSATLIQFMERALSSNLISESVKQTRIAICTMAIDATSLSACQQILERVLLGTWNDLLFSIDFALSARRWGNASHSHSPIQFRARCVMALAVVFLQERDERWQSLAIDQLCVSRSVLQRYLADGNSILLANLISITQKIFHYHSVNGDRSLFYRISLRTLEIASRFDARHTLPELQHEFCNLWNRLVLTARNDNDPHTRSTTVQMLKRMRNIYVALYDGIDSTASTLSKFSNDDPMLNQAALYPLRNTHSHISTLAPLHQALPNPEAAAHTTEDTTRTPAISPVLLQSSESALLTSPPATALHSPQAAAAASSHVYTSHHASSDSAAIPSIRGPVGSVSVYPTPPSSIPAPRTTSIPTYIMTARSSVLSNPTEAMSGGSDPPKPP
jgi:uncharacterized protein DUF6535